MADELDLERGDPDRADDRKRRRRSGGGDAKPADTSAKLDHELHTRMIEAFDQTVEWRAARGDDELAAAIDEDKDKMARGLVSLTHVLVPLRRPLLIFLGFVEPVLAFGRVGRILGERFYARRQNIAQEQAEYDAAAAAAAAAQPEFNAGIA